MAKIIIDTPSPASAEALRDALNNPENAYDAVTTAQNTVEVGINNRTDAAFDLLAGILTALPWYSVPGSDVALAETLKQTARIVDGKRLDRQIDEAINGPSEYGTIDAQTKAANDAAKAFQRRIDPLTFDLDGDGLETSGIAATNPILFDHDGDGIKNGTGWVSSDDAFLVLDKNGNGTIDNGLELFGDNTIKSNGQKAVDGFDALADLDSNGDGVISSADVQFANLRLWRDLNQDGISQAGELFTLNSQNIANINIAKTANSQTLANGNQIADLGSFTRTDGTSGELGEVTGDIADINLAEDTFHREFPDTLDTTAVANLPDMQGSGAVRDLREAATQSSSLESMLEQYSAAATSAAQMVLIDDLLDAWADTSGFAESYQDRIADQTYTDAAGNEVPFAVRYLAFGDVRREYAVETTSGTTVLVQNSYNGGGSAEAMHDSDNEYLTDRFSQLIAEWDQKIHIIEAFNGSYFFGSPQSPTDGAVTGLSFASIGETTGGGGSWVAPAYRQIGLSYTQQQLDLLQESYDAIKSSIYKALLLQTRFKPLLDQINLVIDANGISLDFTDVTAHFEQQIALNTEEGLLNLMEFNVVTKEMLQNTKWNGWALLADTLDSTAMTPELIEALKVAYLNTGNDVFIGSGAADIMSSSSSDNVFFGLDGNDKFYGGSGSDFIYGGTGGDTLNGGSGSDTIYGGAGGDTLNGESGSDFIYGGAGGDTLNGGSGSDTIYGGAEGDTLNGGADSDYLNGEEGGDIIYGNDGNDTIYGGIGDDFLNGGVDSDYLSGGEGSDTILGGDGNNTIYGGVGDDTFYGGYGSDTYIYEVGDGADLIEETTDYNNIYTDQILFGIGINTSDIVFSHPNGTDDLVIEFATPGDQIRITQWFLEDSNSRRIESFVFADGTVWDSSRIKEQVVITRGTTGSETIYGITTGYSNTLLGFDGNDTLYGADLSDTLIGGDGDDILNGSSQYASTDIAGNVFEGGRGSDQFYGTYGSDTYIYNLGDGADVIRETSATNSSSIDRIKLGEGISVTDVNISRSNGLSSVSNLIIDFANQGDQIKVDYWFTSERSNRIEFLEFFDGTVWDINTLHNAGLILNGSSSNDNLIGLDGEADSLYGHAGNDTLRGGSGADSLYGGEGDDVIEGGEGDDFIDGGAGNDTLAGGNGYDTYQFGIGSGQDYLMEAYFTGVIRAPQNSFQIQLGAGISPDDIIFTIPSEGSLIIGFRHAEDTLTVDGYYSAINPLIKFADGTIWDAAIVKGITNHSSSFDDLIIGTMGNDSINGGQGNDTIEGRAGNDYLYGMYGDDTYVFKAGDNGNDIIEESTESPFFPNDNLDVIELYDVLPEDLILQKSQNDLVLTYGSEGNTINIANWYSAENNDINYQLNTIEQIKFISTVDGSITIWDKTTISGMAPAPDSLVINGTSSNDALLGGIGNDTLSGDAGQDYMHGGAGNDLLYGGIGDDQLIGGSGSDTLIGGAGDDYYYVDSIGDVVIESLNQGLDGIISTINYVLPDNVEALVLAEYDQNQQAIIGTGNALDNYINGNELNNILYGGLGDDLLYGYFGNDTLIGGDGNDRYDFLRSWEYNGYTHNYEYVTHGDDVIDELGNSSSDIDVIRFYDVDPNEVAFEKINSDLLIKYYESSVKVSGWYVQDSNTVEQIIFEGAFNTVWDKATIISKAPVDANATPTVLTVIASQAVTEDTVYSYTFPTDSFTDADADDMLSYTVTLANGNPLPSWLSFDATTRTLSGTPSNVDIGNLSITVTATDTSGASALQTFSVFVTKTAIDAVINGTANADAPLSGTSGNDLILGYEGNDQIFGHSGNDTIEGGDGDDFLVGGNADLSNNTGDDQLFGGSGNDVLYAGDGNDTLDGGSGDDMYAYRTGEGQDVIDQTGGGQDYIYFSEINRDRLSYYKEGNDLVILLDDDANQSIRVVEHFLGGNKAISFIQLDDGGLRVSAAEIAQNLEPLPNEAPLVANFISDQVATEDTVFSYVIPIGAFTDADAGDVLSYTVTLSDGNPLPSWLNFDAASRTLSGTPTNDEVGILSLAVTATDLAGASASQTFDVVIDNTNDAPMTSIVINDQTAAEDSSFIYQIPTDSFIDVDAGDVLSYTVTLANGNPLPSWLSFDAATRTLSGTPTNGDVSDLNITVTATDTLGASALQTFSVFVTETVAYDAVINGTSNADAPLLGTYGNDLIRGYEGNDQIFGFSGNDRIEAGDGDDYLGGGDGWSINSGDDQLFGGSGNDTLNGEDGNDFLDGGSGNDAYIYRAGDGQDVIDQTGGGQDYIYFSEINRDRLSYHREGDDLIILLDSDADQSVRVIEHFLGGVKAITFIQPDDGGFGISVTEIAQNLEPLPLPNEAPQAANPIGNQTVNEDATFSYVIPIGAFTDADAGDVLSYTVSLANGDPLPSWLSFDAMSRTLSGIPTNGDVGSLSFAVTATDLAGVSASQTFDVTVDNTNDAPTVSVALANQTINEGSTFSYHIPVDAFADVDVGDILTYTVSLANGNPIPSWLSFNDTTNTISGTPYTEDIGTLNVTVKATDITGASASQNFEVAVAAADRIINGTNAAQTLNGGNGNDTINGYGGNDLLNGFSGNDILDGGTGNDTMVGGLGNDIYFINVTGDVVTEAANAGIDTVNVGISTSNGTYTIAANVENAILTNTVAYKLKGNTLNNYMRGNASSNTLTDTAGGNDILQGLAGTDTFSDTIGNNLFDGGSGNDTITGGSGRDIFIGGIGNDTITTGTGYDVIVFNKGDGADTINASTGADNTLSLGGNFAYSDLRLSKSSNDLILKMGATDQITFKGWYLSSPTNKSVINLQVIAESIQGFELGGTNQLRNNKVERFNFTSLIAAFDAAGATTNWQLTDARLTAHLQAGSDSAAIGGDIAYQYGLNGSLTSMGVNHAQSVIGVSNFGQSAQAINDPNVWQAETVKLA